MANKLSYYSYDKILSLNATYNMILGPRGDGKTYGAKKKATKDALEKGELFIYLRRYKEEVKLSSATFFADIEHLFPDWDFKVNGSAAYAAPISTKNDKKREWTLLGFFIALSRAQQYKSVSFAKVQTIIFDEFVIEKGAIHYLPNETTIVNNFYSTVDRYREKDGRKSVRLFMLANAVAITNPHFIEYGIDPNKADSNGFVKYKIPGRKTPFMVVQFIDDDAFVKDVQETSFGQFIKDTDYSKYAVGNEFLDNHSGLVEGKTQEAYYLYTLETTQATFSIWLDGKTTKYYAQTKRPGNEKVFTLVPENMEEGKVLATFNDKHMQMLRTAFRRGRVLFDRAATRNAFLEIFKR